jgi:hypothetical protein
MRREKTQINKIRNEKGEIIKTPVKSRELLETTLRIYISKMEDLEEMEKLLITYDHPKLNQQDINHLNRSKTHN